MIGSWFVKKILFIIVLGLLWCNVGFTSEAGGIRESEGDQKCFELFKKEKIFEKNFYLVLTMKEF